MTVDTRDPVGRILQQTQVVGGTAPLVENMTWRGNSTLNSYTATRTGAGAWNEARAYTYDARGQLLSEGFAPAPSAAAALNYTFDGNNPGLGVRLDAKIGSGAPASWETSAAANSLGQVITDQIAAAAGGTVPASGLASGVGPINILVDGIMQGQAAYSGGVWSMNLDLAAGAHTLTANAVDASGLYLDTATRNFTVGSANSNQPAGTVASTYDADGNVISRSWANGTIQALTWDAFGRLITVVQRDATGNGFNWIAQYDGLGRRFLTASQAVANNTPSGPLTAVASIYDPQVEFLEIGVNVNGVWAYKVYGPDLNGHFGGMQGTGGLEATIMNGTGAVTGVLNDFFGNGVATISGGSVTWSPTHCGSYGPLPDSTAAPLTDATQLAQATVWRGHRIDPTGFYYVGKRYYEPISARWLSADPLGFAASTSLYEFAGNDPVNNFDPDGRDWHSLPGGGGYMDPGDYKALSGPPLSPREREVISGGLTVAGSIPTMIAGAALSDTGVGAIVGIPTMLSGSTAFGLGMTQIFHGASGAGPVNTPTGTVPGGPLELTGAMTGNPNLQTFGSMADSLFPLPTDAWATLTGANILLNPPEFDSNAWPFSPSSSPPDSGQDSDWKGVPYAYPSKKNCSF